MNLGAPPRILWVLWGGGRRVWEGAGGWGPAVSVGTGPPRHSDELKSESLHEACSPHSFIWPLTYYLYHNLTCWESFFSSYILPRPNQESCRIPDGGRTYKKPSETLLILRGWQELRAWNLICSRGPAGLQFVINDQVLGRKRKRNPEANKDWRLLRPRLRLAGTYSTKLEFTVMHHFFLSLSQCRQAGDVYGLR